MSILLSQITLPPLLLRESYKDVDDLAASIKENGLLYPILLRPISKGKDIPHGITYYEVVAGCRRYTAFKNMGISKLDEGEYIIKKIDDKTAFEIALIENCQRNNMTAQEEAKAFYAYCSQRKYGSVSELASKINRSQPYISARIRLLDLPESIFKDIGVLTNFSVSHAEALTHADLPPERIEEIKNLIDYTGMTVEQTAEIVADQKTHKDSSVGESYLRSETDRANEPYRTNAVAFQSEEDKEEHFEHLPSPKTEKDPRVENIVRLELCAERYTTELDTWIRKFEDLDPKMYKHIVSEVRYPLHQIVGKLQSISKEYRRQLKDESKV